MTWFKFILAEGIFNFKIKLHCFKFNLNGLSIQNNIHLIYHFKEIALIPTVRLCSISALNSPSEQ